MGTGSRIGPGSIRVGEFIGVLGVVSLPAIAVALELDERVVRRHVAKLEAAGWLCRGPWLWGEGSVAWLTRAGIEGCGLDGIRPVKSPPAPTTIAHCLLVEWSAARNERLGNQWHSARELAIVQDRWAIPVRGEHRCVTRLPDLAIWFPDRDLPAAIVAEHGGRRYDRQQAIIEAWRHAVINRRYSLVRFDCANAAVTASIAGLIKKVGGESLGLHARVQTTAEEIDGLTVRSSNDQDAAA